ncbi:MAG: CcoQ/FixQ family Cbb3-type cytochrome c oxidase assembly chaperone [Lachnospiraceae bacterium]|nr:CcoQ/FixQ family Cbb3-type cytochrome c oxidase assembly chaperone [Lachnospiraceae bacterium]
MLLQHHTAFHDQLPLKLQHISFLFSLCYLLVVLTGALFYLYTPSHDVLHEMV